MYLGHLWTVLLLDLLDLVTATTRPKLKTKTQKDDLGPCGIERQSDDTNLA